MQNVIQKLSTMAILPLLLAVLVPVFAVGSVSAKTAPGGTCRLLTNQGQPSTKVAKCITFMPNHTDTNGTSFSNSKCYGLSEHNGSVTIEQKLSCSNPLMSGAKLVTCPDGSPAPNNDKSKCTSSTGVTCTDGSAPPCDTNADPAATGGNCANLAHCDLISKYINPFINFLSALVGVAVVISIVIGGIQYGSSAGDPQKVTAAKNRIRNAIIALLTFLFLYALLNFLIPGGLV